MEPIAWEEGKMPARIDIPKDKIAEFCKRHKIRKLSLFGSVLRDDFRPDSDVDILVEFEPEARNSLFDLMHIQDELGELIGRQVDLVQPQGLENPFRRHEILSSHEIVYAA